MRTQTWQQRFSDGTLFDAWRYLGARREAGGIRFSVWAPNAQRVSLVGDFDGWGEGVPLAPIGGGVWSALVPEAGIGTLYKFAVVGADGTERWKTDPFARACELRPNNAGIVASIEHVWHDEAWMTARRSQPKPLNIYEVHAPSWRMHPDGSFYTWHELAEELIGYVLDMGYTHIELLPVMEHPLDASWGYQVTGFFAATARMGPPEGLMELIDRCHQNGIGVILDWVPGHFCRDAQGLGIFDGTPLFECGDHPQWGTYKFDFGKGAVRSFLISSALWWLTQFHADGLRVDGVTSMLYLNFGLEENDPARRRNREGGEEDLDAVRFLRELNRAVGRRVPGAFTVAEESSAWPLVTYPPENGGLGFHYKWDMGWMNDTLRYCTVDYPFRGDAHGLLNFSMMYAFGENYVLPLSHDEVVHGKKSLIGRMPGDWWRQFAGLRLLFLYQLAHPGGKLCFMGGEFGQFIEWREYEMLEWFLLGYDTHCGVHDFVRAANRLYRSEKAFWECDHGWEGFRWLDADDKNENLLSFLRIAEDGETLVCLLHFAPEVCREKRIGVPEAGEYRELLNSDDRSFGGSGQVNPLPLRAEPVPMHGLPYSVKLTVPPLGGTILKKISVRQEKRKPC